MVQPDERVLNLAAEYFRTLAVPERLRLLVVLRHSKKSVGALALLSGCKKTAVSKHLAVLAERGFVLPAVRTGYYRIADRAVYKLCEAVWRQICTKNREPVRTGKKTKPV